MPTARAMFCILSVTCLLTRKALRLLFQISAWAEHFFNARTLRMLIRSALQIIFIILSLLWLSRLCVSVRSFLPPCASRPRNIGTYMFTAKW